MKFISNKNKKTRKGQGKAPLERNSKKRCFI